MATTHVSETPFQERNPMSSVEYLDSIGYLGERTLLGHCVYVNEADIRRLARTETKVAHNVLTNLALGDGITPVPTMCNYGVTVAMGCDNTSASDTINMVNDLRFAALVHKGQACDAGVMTAERVLEMATVDAARAIGREDDLGSLETGKLADVVLLDLDHPHLTPASDVTAAVVYQAQGFEVDTVLCNGDVVMEDRAVPGILYTDLEQHARRVAEDVRFRAGLDSLGN